MRTAELCLKHGISDATFYNWKAKYGGMTVSEVERLRTLDDQNRRLKKLLAASMPDGSALQDLLGKTDPVCGSLHCGGEAMADHGFSECRACRLIGVSRSAWQYEPVREKDDAVRERMREIANERRRFGYRRLAILLKREGKGLNPKKV